MNEIRLKSYNIGWDIVGERCVTTAAIASSSPHIGYYRQFETFIWHWDGKERTKIIHQVIHPTHEEAEKVHGYIVNNLKKRRMLNG